MVATGAKKDLPHHGLLIHYLKENMYNISKRVNDGPKTKIFEAFFSEDTRNTYTLSCEHHGNSFSTSDPYISLEF